MRGFPRMSATVVALAALVVSVHAAAPAEHALYRETFKPADYGKTPAGWLDLTANRPSRAWAVDDAGFLRVMLKKYTGLVAYDGALAAGAADQIKDAVITTELKKAEDDDVAFGVVCRL